MDKFVIKSKRNEKVVAGKRQSQSVKRKRENSMPSANLKVYASRASTFPKARDAPLKIVTWNANGLGVRLKNDKASFGAFLQAEKPDLICVQEVRLKCLKLDGKVKRSKLFRATAKSKKSDKEEEKMLNRVLREAPFCDYAWYWSLAKRKKEGVWCAHKYAGVACGTYFGLQLAERVTNFQSHATLLVFPRRDPAGVRRESCKLPHTVKRSFVRPNGEKLPTDPLTVDEGRILVLQWSGFHLLHTYVPNSKFTEDGRSRRKLFDAQVVRESQVGVAR